MSLDFNDENTRLQHQQMIAIFLANRNGDDLINSKRADWHIENHMAGGKPTQEAITAAATEFLVMWEWLKAYRDFYAAEAPPEPEGHGHTGQMAELYDAGQRIHRETVERTERRANK